MTGQVMTRGNPMLKIQLDDDYEASASENRIREMQRILAQIADKPTYLESVHNWRMNTAKFVTAPSIKRLWYKGIADEGNEYCRLVADVFRSQYTHHLATIALPENWEQANKLAVVVQKFSDANRIDDLIEWAVSTEEEAFESFRLNLKETRASVEQHAAALTLNEIEERASQYPMCSVAQAAKLLGDINTKNPSRVIATAKKEHRLFAFTFGNAKSVQVPFFQFNTESLGVYKPIPTLCRILDGINDWGTYQWLTTHSDDLETTPAEAVKHKSLHEDLIILAGLFKSQTTFSDLSFTAAEVDNDN